MNEYKYCVHFVGSGIKVFVNALEGEVAVNRAVKKLESEGIKPGSLRCKINFWRV